MGKILEFPHISGTVEYRYESEKTETLHEEEKEAACFFTEHFRSLTELLNLLSPDFLKFSEQTKGLKRVWVESIQLMAKNSEGNSKIELFLTHDGCNVELIQ